jgi:hypothetical protein
VQYPKGTSPAARLKDSYELPPRNEFEEMIVIDIVRQYFYFKLKRAMLASFLEESAAYRPPSIITSVIYGPKKTKQSKGYKKRRKEYKKRIKN